ncbi:MAG: DUF748 domain-containing protein [Holophaga sp.]|jgi:hypothetical protein
MRIGRSLKNLLNQRTARPGRWLTPALGLCLCGVVLLAVVLIPWLGGAILNGYGKRKVERAFAEAHPGYVLRIGALDYSLGANRLAAQNVTLDTPSATLAVGRVTLAGVRWARLLLGRAAPAEVFAKASLDATGLGMEFTHAHYGVHTARLRASVAGSELIAEGTELRPLLGDQALFAADAFRTTRFHVVVPECRVMGWAFTEWIQAGAFRAREVHVLHPSFDLLADRDKPVRTSGPSPLMVDEALAAIRPPLQLDLLSITDGHLTYGERVTAGAAPGVLTFTALDLRAEDITNRGGASAAIRLKAQGKLMDAGALKVLMTIPLMGPDVSLRYSGTLSAMDLTSLDAFLDRAEHIRIKSGRVEEVAFEVGVIAGQAHGQVRASYRDLKMAVLDRATGTEKGLGNRVASFLMNTFKLRHSNGLDAMGVVKVGKVDYRKKRDDTFMQVVWFSLRSGVLDIIK